MDLVRTSWLNDIINHAVHQQTVSLLVEGLFYSPKEDNADSVADAYTCISNTRFGLCIFCGTFERSYQIMNVLIIWLKYLILRMFWMFLIWCDLAWLLSDTTQLIHGRLLLSVPYRAVCCRYLWSKFGHFWIFVVCCMICFVFRLIEISSSKMTQMV